MKTIVNNGYKIVEYFHQSKTYASKVLWKVYESDGRLRAVCQTEEDALHFTRPLPSPTWI
jgi:hypothetical protein